MCAMHAYDYAAFGRLIVPTALNADSVRDVRNACVRLRRLWAANRTYGAMIDFFAHRFSPQYFSIYMQNISRDNPAYIFAI